MNAVLRSILFSLDPETAHRASILALKSGALSIKPPPATPRLEINLVGLRFPNPLGIAAGYDKNAEVPHDVIALGFGFAEVGSVTPRPQPGNPKPRIFRLKNDRAVINRLGFNNEGHAACLRRLKAVHDPKRIIGVNIGANKDSDDKVADYEAGIDAFAGVASYFTINISSPNTPGLRDLQTREHLSALLERVTVRRDKAAANSDRPVPLFLKIAPDLRESHLDDIAAEVENRCVDGLIISNTTLDRSQLTEKTLAQEAGGLSGNPLFERSTSILAKMRQRCGAEIAIIGVGGVDSAETALEKIRAGADLVQLYTGLIYEGPGLPRRIVSGLERVAEADGLTSIRELRDSNLQKWADMPLD